NWIHRRNAEPLGRVLLVADPPVADVHEFPTNVANLDRIFQGRVAVRKDLVDDDIRHELKVTVGRSGSYKPLRVYGPSIRQAPVGFIANPITWDCGIPWKADLVDNSSPVRREKPDDVPGSTAQTKIHVIARFPFVI